MGKNKTTELQNGDQITLLKKEHAGESIPPIFYNTLFLVDMVAFIFVLLDPSQFLPSLPAPSLPTEKAPSLPGSQDLPPELRLGKRKRSHGSAPDKEEEEKKEA